MRADTTTDHASAAMSQHAHDCHRMTVRELLDLAHKWLDITDDVLLAQRATRTPEPPHRTPEHQHTHQPPPHTP